VADVKFYLFGSFLKSNKPNDIDILILYDNSLDSNLSIVLGLKKVLKEKAESIFSIPLDITLLSYMENDEVNFIETEKAILFYSSH
jgi:predicted nucleotidyltransferase